ncbi:hypothetical protein HRG_007001 [Hirsutella rhossiliensis]|uniref:PLC-like phosphodiesterase n=1 Tax=Hirsutella rhossiliensis TaxID=111463 RepID=A0A9P8SGL7_9HYPO|nr:uncharacterized protein HRG_07001 [Hirsutella rhossiliensis]KAH0961921.1 hypothetical protein HRG_07001 [Hirsutella rhossiliensis]
MRLRAAVAAAAAGGLLPPMASAQSVSLAATSDLTFITGARSMAPQQTAPPTGIYVSYASKITLTGSNSSSTETSASSATGTSTQSSEPPRNTQPCNNYLELCGRRYGNITNVGAHNSPFVRPGNSGSNQELPVKTQLDDGVRLVQGQMQWPVNGSVPHFCHTTCDLLDAGPITDWLTQVREWVDAHPYDVVTVLLGNGNYSTPDLYAPYIEQTGILKYTYEAPFLPMALDDWPTLEDLIVRGKRVVMFMDYKADQKKYPWLLDEFAHMWESPFDPQDRNFPCPVQRPPGLSNETARDRLYLANHNLNVQFNVFGAEVLVPAVAVLNQTNAAEGPGSLGLAANNCRNDWGRTPNFLHVDYYNYGQPPGSVFEVAARANNVTYNRTCCGKVSSAPATLGGALWPSVATLMLAMFLIL